MANPVPSPTPPPPAGEPRRLLLALLAGALLVPAVYFVTLVVRLAWPPAAPKDEAAQPRVLRWGGDAAGGAPYIYNNGRSGFEVDLADYLGQRLGRTPVFVQADWDAIPDTLTRSDADLDVALNGFEYLPDRGEGLASTLPYYVYTLRLIVRRADPNLRGWDDMRQAKGGRKRVGVLRGSVAERYMRAKFGDSVEVVPTREVDETFQLVEGGERLDATVQDSPAATYYVESGRLAKLEVVGEPAAPNYYVMLTRKKDEALRAQLNDALREALSSGELERIYRKYQLWTPEQERLRQVYTEPWPPGAAGESFGALTLASLGPAILRAAGMTLALAVCAMPLAIAIGVVVAVGRLYGPWWVRLPLAAYVEVLRGTPLLLQMFVLFFLLPLGARWVGWQPLIAVATLPPFVVGVLGLAINYSAAEAENYRAGLLAIPAGQMEAGLALGMGRLTVLRRVILPQAMRLVVPPVTNDFIALFKDTSICSTILITELTGLYYQNKYDREVAWQLALVVAALYLAMSYPLAVLARRLERKQQQVQA